uniref:NACHT LRR and PYD domain-containing protein n=1 Tax=Sinocyclocheilus grahami TaxID=75366 RepID=A0A672QYH0_SINGR
MSPERSINLFYCLNELNNQTLVKEIQTHLSKGSLSSADLSPAQWSDVAFVLLTSEEELEEFELQKFKKSDECLVRLSAVIKTSKRALSCSALATILGSDTNLKELNMNNNNLQDSGVKLLCTGLENIKCELEILRNISLIQTCCIKYVTGIVGKNLLLLRELNLSEHELGDTRVNQITALLSQESFNSENKHLVFLNSPTHFHHFSLRKCGLTEESCSALATVLRSNSSLKELDMSNNNLQDSGVKKLQNGLEDTNCALQKLRLSDCSITEEGYKALASALRSNPSHLIELDLRGNDPGPSGVKQLSDLLQDESTVLFSKTILKEINLNNSRLLDSGVKEICEGLKNPVC